MCSSTGRRLVYANVRMSARSFRGYQRFQGLVEPTLKKISHFAVQSASDADRMCRLGAPEEKVTVTGSIKFDVEMPASVQEAGRAVRRQLGADRPIWVAASTHEGEEATAIHCHRTVREQYPDALLVLVPRHPERFPHVQRLCEKENLQHCMWSSVEGQISSEVEAVIVDAMGQLPNFLSASDVVFMGGSFAPVGGHNLLEPAALSRATVYGPHMFNFSEISGMFLESGAAVQVDNKDALAKEIVALLGDPARRDSLGTSAAQLVDQNRGAIDRLMKIING